MDRWRRVGQFYWTLVFGMPGYIWRAAEVTGRIALLIVVALSVVFGVRGEVPIWLLVGIGAIVVVVALLAANYDRYAGLENMLQAVKLTLNGVARQYADSTRYMVAVQELLNAQGDGSRLLSDLAESMKSGDGSRPEMRARVDHWESDAEARIAKWCDPSELDFFRRPLASVALTGKWKQDLFEQVNVRVVRVAAIQARKLEAQNKWLDGL